MDTKTPNALAEVGIMSESPAAALTKVQEQGSEAFKDIAFGSIAGTVGKIVEYPFDTVKVRLQSQPDHLPLRYTGPLDCFRQSVSQDGLRGLYRGVSAPLFGAAAETACLFWSYSVAQDVLKRTVVKVKDGEELPLGALITAGAMSGGLTATILTPIELVKCRMQVSGSSASPSPLTVIRSVFGREGVRGFWRGHTGTFLRETGGTAAWFGAWEATTLFSKTRIARAKDVQASEVTLPISQQMFCGAIAGMSYNFLFYPADTIKSKIQTGELSHTGVRPTFLGTGRELWRIHGMKGLYRLLTSSKAITPMQPSNEALPNSALKDSQIFEMLYIPAVSLYGTILALSSMPVSAISSQGRVDIEKRKRDEEDVGERRKQSKKTRLDEAIVTSPSIAPTLHDDAIASHNNHEKKRKQVEANLGGDPEAAKKLRLDERNTSVTIPPDSYGAREEATAYFTARSCQAQEDDAEAHPQDGSDDGQAHGSYDLMNEEGYDPLRLAYGTLFDETQRYPPIQHFIPVNADPSFKAYSPPPPDFSGMKIMIVHTCEPKNGQVLSRYKKGHYKHAERNAKDAPVSRGRVPQANGSTKSVWLSAKAECHHCKMTAGKEGHTDPTAAIAKAHGMSENRTMESSNNGGLVAPQVQRASVPPASNTISKYFSASGVLPLPRK
ncbi:mitochondrial ornithine carrier protein [Elasticomyces elasticus]|uniref:Mitochondrial ornithine carrier protein n=1 Tax=Elasticomyces elasticus TaxID=574655 RepID=A0AAN7WQL3_9PEZI|nr:mitochondrial ornithine carrier protein [Elasticomyces elasticus]